ncbi:cell wall hydrolase [uncultured Devosia sp.]|uniref:cell wall hydrolase n=1 Tax=uncultured Devosia sp. TaxID=211434 RepID=UPI00260EEFE2|nr:cell wall hydrolase [uncultured Devosia sp.]
MDWNIGAGARTAWQECRGEPIEGQRAVCHVLVNRLHDGRWGDSLGEVVFSEYKGWFQFSGWNRDDPNRAKAFRLADNDPVLVSLAQMLGAALIGEADPTGGATHYFNPKIVKAPSWVAGSLLRRVPPAIFCGQFGNQLFYRGVK